MPGIVFYNNGREPAPPRPETDYNYHALLGVGGGGREKAGGARLKPSNKNLEI